MRLRDPKFLGTFGFVYAGYHIDRGLVVAWEAFVMVRKLAVTAITVSSSDPYIQIFVALLLLIVSYGMQERFHPFEATYLNNVEGLGLFSLIFTQIISILYLYVDSRSITTGNRDRVLEICVTGILIVANVMIVLVMVGSYVFAYWSYMHAKNTQYAQLNEERKEPFGALTKHRNPHVAEKKRLQIFETLVDCKVYTKPRLDSEVTGEIAESGDRVLIRGTPVEEYLTRRCRGRKVLWLQRADGQGWMKDRDERTGDFVINLVDFHPDDNT
jgi:hypothetical protein